MDQTTERVFYCKNSTGDNNSTEVIVDIAHLTRDASENKLTANTKISSKERIMMWINKQMKIEMTDGRVLIGVFLCTDRDGNVILGSCSEFLTEACGFFEEPRMLGLVMVPGRHIVSIHHAPNNVVEG